MEAGRDGRVGISTIAWMVVVGFIYAFPHDIRNCDVGSGSPFAPPFQGERACASCLGMAHQDPSDYRGSVYLCLSEPEPGTGWPSNFWFTSMFGRLLPYSISIQPRRANTLAALAV